MNFDEWDENKTVFPNSMEKGYARAAWNAAIDEAVKAVEAEYVGVSEQYEQDGFDLADKIKELKQ